MDNIRSGKIVSSKELKLAMDYIEKKINKKDVIMKSEMVDKAVELIEKYFEIEFLDWELFILALIHCYYKSNADKEYDEEHSQLYR